MRGRMVVAGVVGVAVAVAAAGAVSPGGAFASSLPAHAAHTSSGLPGVPPPPEIWNAPAQANRTVVGGLPIGPWTYSGSGLGIGIPDPTPPSPSTSSTRSSSSPAVSPAGQTPADDAVAAPGLGIQSFYKFDDVTLGQKQSIGVNLANGNLVERDTDLAVNGPGIGVRLDRFYNGLSSRSGTFGPKWSISAGADIGLEIGTGAPGGVPAGQVVFRAPSGFRATFTAVSGSSTAFTAPAGLKADLVKQANGTYTVTYHSNSEKLSFTAGGYLTSDADRNGNALTYAYNPDNTLASLTDAAGRVTTFTYSSGLLHSMTDPGGRNTAFYYTGGLLTSVTDARSNVTTYSYDGSGRLQYITTYGKSVTLVGYDTSGRVTSLTRYLTRSSTSGPTAVTTFGYSSSSGASISTVVTDADSHASTFGIDSSGRATSVKDALGNQRSVQWYPSDDVESTTDAMAGAGQGGNGNVTSYMYDASNNPIQVQAPTGATATATYTTGGPCGSTDSSHPYQAKCTYDTAGDSTSYTYDTAGNPLSVKDTSANPVNGGVSKTYTYQGSNGVSCGAKPGQVCTVKDGNGGVTSYGYDSDGNVTTVTPPAPRTATTYGYDSVGRLTSSIDGKGQHVAYSYDAGDHLTQTNYPSAVVQGNFTADGYQYAATDPVNDTIGTTFDALNRPTVRTASNTSQTFTVTLDGVGNTLTSVDPSGTTTYGYDAANELISIAQPGGTRPAITNPASPPPGTYCTRYGYDSNGAQTSITYPGATVTTTTRDASGRPSEVKTVASAANGGAVLSDQKYSWQAPGTTTSTGDRAQLQTRTYLVAAGIPAGNLDTYGYDTLGRLKTVTETTSSNAAYASWAYTLDANGNRTAQTRTGSTGATGATGATAGTVTAGYNADNELTSLNGSTTGLAYDDNGNQTASPAATGTSSPAVPAVTATVNERDQVLSQVSTPAGSSTSNTSSFTYAGSTNALATSVTTAGATTTLLTGLLGMQQSLDGANSNTPTSYTYTPGGTLVGVKTPGGGRYYYAYDATGSTTALVGVNGAAAATYSYDPYATTRATTGTGPAATANRYRYAGATGATTDPVTGLVKLGARYYDPTTGRFTQPDPSGQEANTYLYASADPINHIDPSGLDSADDGFTTLGLAAGFGSALAVEAPPVAIGLAAVSVGASLGQAAYSCSGNGDVSCETAAVGFGISLATLGTGQALKAIPYVGSAVNVIGTAIGGALGFSSPA